jgi:molybdopterin converting factor small subunit
MTVHYRLIGRLKQMAKITVPEGSLAVRDGARISELYPKLGIDPKLNILIVVNQKVSSTESLISDGDRVTFIPANVSGG